MIKIKNFSDFLTPHHSRYETSRGKLKNVVKRRAASYFAPYPSPISNIIA